MKKIIALLLLLTFLAVPARTALSQEPEEYLAYLPLVTVEDNALNFLPVVMNNTPVPQPTPFLWTNSYYITSIEPDKMYNLGCDLGTRDAITDGIQDSLVILDFGSPTNKNGELGASLLSSNPTATTTLALAVETYAKGYYDCTAGDYSSHLTIGIGTTNYQLSGGTGWTGAVTRDHGHAWTWMVNAVNDYIIQQGYSSQVSVVGANDLEVSFNTPANTIPWIDAYDDWNLYPLIDFGDLAGCPTRLRPDWTCGNGWTMDNVWYKAYGASPNSPLPEIYLTYGTNARQWAYLSHWAVLNKEGHRIDFLGTLTQWTACEQSGYNGCYQNDTDPDNDTNNTPFQGYDQLYDELLYWPETAQELRWASDMMWK